MATEVPPQYVGITDWVGEMLGAEPKGGDGAGLGGVLNYLAGHRDRMNYALRLKRGQSIGTGMVEGAAKNLIGRRLKANNARCGERTSGKWPDSVRPSTATAGTHYWVGSWGS